MSSSAIILAGGFGTRISKITKNRIPKSLIVVNNKPFIYWLIMHLKKNRIKNIIISTGFRGDLIESYVKNLDVSSINISCLREDQPLGTAGALLNVINTKQIVDSGFFVFNGDSLFLNDFNNKKLSNLTIYAFRNFGDSVFGSLKFDSDLKLNGFYEKEKSDGYVNSGVYYFPSGLFESVTIKPMSLEREFFPELIGKNFKINVEVSNAPFIDIGTLESYAKATNFIKKYITFFE